MSEDGVLDGDEDEADVLGVGGAGEVGVQRLLLVGVLVLVHLQDELLGRLCLLRRACILWEIGGEVREQNLLFQDVGLVEEEDDGGLLKPGVCDDGLKQSLALLHPILVVALH